MAGLLRRVARSCRSGRHAAHVAAQPTSEHGASPSCRRSRKSRGPSTSPRSSRSVEFRSDIVASDAENEAAVQRAMQTTRTTQWSQRTVTTLSGGERARVLLARVLAGESDWILADEPFAGLDPAHQFEAADLLRSLAGHGRGVVLTIHDLALAARIADRVVILHRRAGRCGRRARSRADAADAARGVRDRCAMVLGARARRAADRDPRPACRLKSGCRPRRSRSKHASAIRRRSMRASRIRSCGSGKLIEALERRWNDPARSDAARRTLGIVTMMIVAGGAGAVGYAIQIGARAAAVRQ